MPPRKNPPPYKNRAEEIAHYNGVLIENLRDEFRMVIEHVDGVKEQLIRRMDERFAKQDGRFDVIEAVLRHHSQMLQTNEERWTRNEVRLEGIESRLGGIESKLDQVIEKVERHDQEITTIKAVIPAAH